MWISRKEYDSLLRDEEKLWKLSSDLDKILPSELHSKWNGFLDGLDFSAIHEAAAAIDSAERSKRDKELVALVKRIRGEK